MEDDNKCMIGLMMAVLQVLAMACRAENVSVDNREFHPGDTIPEACLQDGQADRFFSVRPIPEAVFARMQGKSFKAKCVVPRDSLRYLTCLHTDINGVTKMGEMVVHVSIAKTVLGIFRELYENAYPIERMRLIDDYDAVDEASMRDNNSSSFNFRFISHTRKVSKHGKGIAVDINPLYNPYFRHTSDCIGIRYDTVEPATGAPYVDRTRDFPYKIVKGDLCYRLFRQHGFEWGGEWYTCKDYQHFELP